ncbi:MAG: HDOD domain-containing protein, partial [Methylococcaceae bacterium]
MQIEAKLQATRDVLKSVHLPIQPAVVTELVKLTNNPNVGTDRVGKELKKEPLLVAKVLKIINSPAFGLRHKVQSIEQAVSFMGISMFQKAVLASAMRDVFAVGQDPRDAMMFWNHSEIVASACELIATKRFPQLTMQAYLSGLFHDCAVPLLGSKFPDYQPLVEMAMDYKNEVLEIEEAETGTNHCLLGYFFAKSWSLPESVCQTILHHHDENFDDLEDTTVQVLNSVLLTSEYLIQNYDVSGNIKTMDTAEWADLNRSTLD